MTLMKKLVLATALALPASAGLAQGVEHRVLVERWGYFPTPIYVKPGDTIVFENAAPNWVNFQTADPFDNLAGYDFSAPCAVSDSNGDGNFEPHFTGSGDGFNRPWFNIGETTTVAVTECMETQFRHPEVWQFSHDGDALVDLIVFGDAPNGN